MTTAKKIRAESTLWEATCRDFEQRRLEAEGSAQSPSSDVSSYDGAVHHPAFVQHAFARVQGDYDGHVELDQATSHPACAGVWMDDISHVEGANKSAFTADFKTCPAALYVESLVWPTLEKALNALLNRQVAAKGVHWLDQGRPSFDACDFLVRFLYNNNPNHPDRLLDNAPLKDIPFVSKWLSKHPRPPTPPVLSEDAAATIIQKWCRGYAVRKRPQIRDLRNWQKVWRLQDHSFVKTQVNEFWQRQMPDMFACTEKLDRLLKRYRSSKASDSLNQSQSLSDLHALWESPRLSHQSSTTLVMDSHSSLLLDPMPQSKPVNTRKLSRRISLINKAVSNETLRPRTT